MTIRTLRSSRAFTLIELLIVITIIGILAVALLPRITAGPSKARDAQRKADLQQIATALALYADDHSSAYPWGSTTSGCIFDYTSSLTSYMTSLPADPQASATVGQGAGCTYSSQGDSYGYYATYNGFALTAKLENNTQTGTGIYRTSNVTAANIPPTPSTATTSAAVTTMAAYLCGTVDCTASGATAQYVLFR